MEAACDEASGGNAGCNGTLRSAWVLSPTNSRHWLIIKITLSPILWEFFDILIYCNLSEYIIELFEAFNKVQSIFFTVNAKVRV